MKKYFAIIAMMISGSVFAASANVEYQNINGLNGTTDQNSVSLTVKENITKNFTGDVNIIETQNVSNSAPDKLASTRLETGLTGVTNPLFAGASLYTRAAIGQKYTTTTNFGYYSVEPGVMIPLGAGFSAKVGYRFRTAFDSDIADQTRTIRTGLSYDLSSKDTIAVRYDRIRGDATQNAYAINYTRGF